MLDPLTVMILKRVSESIFFQINKFTACKFTKEVANSLMAFNLLKIIHPFQGKQYLKVVSATFLLVCFLSLNESTCPTRNYAFYFISKTLFVLEKIKF